MLKDMLNESLPALKISKLEATYLPMVDLSPLGISSEEAARLLEQKAKILVNPSDMYGCEGFLRINIATQRDMLREGIRRFIATFNS